MARPSVQPTDIERPFGVDELFFSTTDEKGVIRSGNSVFARVSGFGKVEELIGKPHNTIRHPDMPRAVFHLLWSYLGQGKAIACYVKNLATDGGYYWVMALVVPAEGGYLSIRFKPTSPFLAEIQTIYGEMAEIERAHNTGREERECGMDLAGQHLVERLKARGFEDYDAFMATVLSEEMASRDAAIGHRTLSGTKGTAIRDRRAKAKDGIADFSATLEHSRTILLHLNGLFSMVQAFLTLNSKLRSKSSSLLGTARSIRLLSVNALIQCSHLGDSGHVLAVIADRMAKLSMESTITIGDTADGIQIVAAALREAAFIITSARLQVEMAVFFTEELIALRTGREDVAEYVMPERTRADISTLLDTFSSSTTRMLVTLPELAEPLSRLHLQADRLSTSLRMLGLVHTAGKVEAARAERTSQFAALFEQVRSQVGDAHEEMNDFLGATAALSRDMARTVQPAIAIREAMVDLESVVSHGAIGSRAAAISDRSIDAVPALAPTSSRTGALSTAARGSLA